MARIGKNQLIKLQKRYKTDGAIAGLYGMTRQAVHRLRKKYGIPPVTDRHSERNEQIRALRKNGMSIIKIAKKYNLSTMQTYRIVKEHTLDT